MEMDVTPDLTAQSLLFLACLAAWVWRRPLVAFLDDCSDGNVSRLERIDEARAWLACMEKERVA